MLEMEERQRKENRDREERYRRKEHEFRLKLLQLLFGQSVFPTPPSVGYYTWASGSSGLATESMHEWPTD